MVRLQKYLAESGVASRRAAEAMIVAGRVTVNGKVVQVLGTKVHPGQDDIRVDSTPAKARRKLYVALNKPPGYLCTRKDERERLTISDLLPREWQHLASVGRLDRESEGLIFLSNDGQFSLRLTHPRYGTRKIYRVAVEGRVEQAMLDKIRAGVEHDGEMLKAEKVRLISANNSHSVVELELAEGKNREVRRLFESQGLFTSRLQRIQIGPIKLGELPVGKWRALTEPEINSLLRKI